MASGFKILLLLLLPFASVAINITLGCWEDVAEFLSDLNAEEPKAYAVKMYDSVGKPGINVPGGNVDRLGSYTECISVEAPSGRFRGQYCKLQVQQDGIDYYNGLCAPSSCHEEEITALAVLGKLTVILLFVACFSLQNHLPAIWLMKPCKEVSLSLSGIRALSLLWVISGHTSQMTAWQNLDNELEWEAKVLKNPIYVFSLSGPFYLGVDTFFLISGFLSCQSFLNMLNLSEKRITFRLTVKYLWCRFFRLQPLHIYSLCLLIGFYSVTPWGTFWEISKLEVDNCRRTWWANLLLINNFIAGQESCNGWTWYLANDFQFYFTTPLLVYISMSKQGIIILGTLLFLTTFTVTALLSSFYRLPVANPRDMRKTATVMYFAEYYSKPYCRYGPFLVGLVLMFPQVQASIGWLSATFSMFMVVALAYALQDPLHYSPATAIYQATHRTVWAIAVGWIIFACEEGYGGFINWMLSWGFWSLVAKISYACYLVHPMLILLYNGLQETPMHYSDMNMFYLFLGHCLMTFMVGLALTVMVEMPLQALRRAVQRQVVQL
uniref:Nose resistant-to-fluoxetine protein N-terminal domain-containing protein n=1 Tax=Podarcis muralis TaxID=64176 RepID=A0A670IZ16_PODMU